MNALSLFTKSYGLLRNYGMPFWIMTPLRRLVRSIANWYLPRFLAKPVAPSSLYDNDLIVSLTSFPGRINDVWKVIESLKRQTVKPGRIILWLSIQQFPSKSQIPQSLTKLEDELFSIRLVDEDFRSHKKYFYSIREFPDKTIITCDDDVYYDEDMIRRLVDTAKRYPNCIISNYASRIKHGNDGSLLPYLKWSSDIRPYNSDNLLQIGAGGVLYPPGCLHDLVLNSNVFMNVCPLADDIWLNSMARLKGTPVVKSMKTVQLLPVTNNAPSLSSVNNGNLNYNDKQIKQLRNYLISNDLEDVYSSNCNVEFKLWGGKIIASLTSFPARINNVWQVVECMLRQTVHADKIILWLSKDQFPSDDSIPLPLRERIGDMFEIRIVPGDIRSHKKYYYAAKEFPNDLLFLIDDDIYYPNDILERSLRAFVKHPHSVVCSYGSHIIADRKKQKASYDLWKSEYSNSEADNLFFGSGGGTLFIPSTLYKDLTNISLALKLTPTADDIWLNAMCKLSRLHYIMLAHGEILTIDNPDAPTLSKINNGMKQNDIQIKAVETYYKQKIFK